MTEFRFFRTATAPEFVRYEIEPALVAAELPTTLAETVAKMMDASGWSLADSIRALQQVVAAQSGNRAT